jgi:hypothetical protein
MDLSKDIEINLNPKIWGPHAWFFIESIIISYPKNPTIEEKKSYVNFFNSLPDILPCQKCREHFKHFLNRYPLDNSILKSKDKFITWILSAHNNVKKENNSKNINIKKFYEFYNKQYNTKDNNGKCTTICGIDKPIIKNHLSIINKKKLNHLYVLLYGFIITICLINIVRTQ